MTVVRRSLAATAFFAAGLLVSSPAGARVVESILAVVDDEVILQSDVEERERPFVARLDAAPSAMEREAAACRLRKEVIGTIIDEELLDRQAKKLHLTISTQEINRAVENVRSANRLSEEEFAQALVEQGFSIERYRAEVRRQLLELKVLNARVAGRVSITEADIRDEYNRTVRELRARDPFHGAMIFVSLPAEAGAVEASRRRALAEDIANRVRRGEDFSALARRYSEHTETRENGGDLEVRRRGELVPYLDDAFLDMAPGDVRGPIRTPEGLFVLKLLERDQTGVRPFDEVKDGIRADLMEREMARQRRMFLREQRRQTYVDIREDCG